MEKTSESYNPRFCRFYDCNSRECLAYPRTRGFSVELAREGGYIRSCLMTERREGQTRPMTWKNCPEYRDGCRIIKIRESLAKRLAKRKGEQAV